MEKRKYRKIQELLPIIEAKIPLIVMDVYKSFDIMFVPFAVPDLI